MNLVNVSGAESSMVGEPSMRLFSNSFLLNYLASSHSACFSLKAYEAARVSFSPMIIFSNKGCSVGSPFLRCRCYVLVASNNLGPSPL